MDGSCVGRNPYERALELSELEGCRIEVVLPEPRELFIDIDNDEQLKVYEERIQLLRCRMAAVEKSRRRSRHGAGWHIIVELTIDRDLTPAERIALQAGLGSDPIRELLSAVETINRNEWPMSVFFEVRA